jgi:hypothetical protein
MEKLIRSLHKRDFKELGISENIKLPYLYEQLLSVITNEDEKQIISILRNVIDRIEGLNSSAVVNDNVKLKIKHFAKTIIINDEEFNQKQSIIQIDNYGEWHFNNLYYDVNENIYHEKTKKGFKLKNVHIIPNNPEGAISVKDTNGVRRLLYINKLKGQL